MRIYVIVPRTVDSDASDYKLCMTCGRMAAHVGHVSGILASDGVNVANEDLIVLSVASSKDLKETATKLKTANIRYVEYWDEDKAFDGKLLTAIATYPVQPPVEDLKALKPWRCKCN